MVQGVPKHTAHVKAKENVSSLENRQRAENGANSPEVEVQWATKLFECLLVLSCLANFQAPGAGGTY